MYTLTVVFSEDKSHVLMCKHNKQGMLNFIGGSVINGEHELDASYRELYEETGITKDDLSLEFVRMEQVTSAVFKNVTWSIYLTVGVMNKKKILSEEKNPLYWVPIADHRVFQYDTFGLGNCWMFLLEAASVVNVDVLHAHQHTDIVL